MAMVRLNIGAKLGESHVSPDVFPPGIKVDKRYFYDFMSYLVATVGLAHAVESVHGEASIYQPMDTAVFGCKQSPGRWYWAPAALLGQLALQMNPTEIYIKRFDAEPVPFDATLRLGGMRMLLQTFAQALLTNYFERYKGAIRHHYGDVSKWPAVWNFARIVRNAMSHGGLITIKRAADPVGVWKGLTYSIENNGAEILQFDLWPGDLFDLIIEMDEALPPT